MLDIVLDKIKKMIGSEKFVNTKILIDTDDKLPIDFTLKSIVILIKCIINNNSKFYLQIFLEKTLFVK